MNPLPPLRRVAAKLARHAASVLPRALPWAEAMRREIDYIEDDRAALAWAFGCVLASYKARLAARPESGLGGLGHVSSERNRNRPGSRGDLGWLRGLSSDNRKHLICCSDARTWEVLRHAAASCALMLLVGLALLENGGGQAAPAPSPPVHDQTACDKADEAHELGPDLDRSPARTLPSSTVAGRPTHETSCADRQAPVRVLPK